MLYEQRKFRFISQFWTNLQEIFCNSSFLDAIASLAEHWVSVGQSVTHSQTKVDICWIYLSLSQILTYTVYQHVKHLISCNTKSSHVTQCHTMLHIVIQCNTMLYRVTQCQSILHNVTQCYTISYNFVQYHTKFHNSIPKCHTLLHNVKQYYFMLHNIIPC